MLQVASLALMALVVGFDDPAPAPLPSISEARNPDFVLVYCDLAYDQKGPWRDRLLERQLRRTEYRLLSFAARHMLETNSEQSVWPPLYIAREQAHCDKL